MLIDHTQVRRVNEPVYTGRHVKATTSGDWGHYTVGGERLRCNEIDVLYGDPHVSFCFEKLTEAYRSPQHDLPTIDRRHERTQYRPQ
eukprot:8955912-Karenia_brevis.AAC.1